MKILFIGHRPPPVHGVSVMNNSLRKFLHDKQLQIKFINLSLSRSHMDIRKVNFRKLVRQCAIFTSTLFHTLIFRPNVSYITISPLGFGFYKDFIIVLIALLGKSRVIIHLHGIGIGRQVHNSIFRTLILKYIMKCELIFLSDTIRNIELLNEVRLEQVKYHIVENGINPIQCDSKIQRNKTTRILFLSNLKLFKGIDTFLWVVSNISQSNPDVLFDIVGAEGDMTYREVKEILNARNLTNVILHGAKYAHEKAEILTRADILVYPTRMDAFPLVLLEALSVGLPVVTYDIGGIRDIVENDVTGLICKENDREELLVCVQRLIDDKLTRARYSSAARARFVERFSEQKFKNRMLKILDTDE